MIHNIRNLLGMTFQSCNNLEIKREKKDSQAENPITMNNAGS